MEYPQRQIDQMFCETIDETVDLSNDTIVDQTSHPMYDVLLQKGYSEEDIIVMFGLEEE